MEEAHDYRFAPVLEPEPEPAPVEVGVDSPVQQEIATGPGEPSPVKPALRAEMRGKRDALSEKERNAGARRIVERLMQHPDVHRAKTVLLYASYGSEVNTDELARELLKRGKAVAYPKITAVAGLMTLWRVKTLDALIPHKHGIRAPDVTRSSPIEPIALDCVIYPGVAFTKGLARLGQGGGYYDRLSGKIADNCARIGICFETQLADNLPLDEHDAKMHWVVTEVTVYPFVPDPPVITPIAVPMAGVTASDAAVPSVSADAPADANAAALTLTPSGSTGEADKHSQS